jgi:hypothetical protein
MEISMQDERPRATIYEVARRYTCCLYALSDILGLDPYTVLTKHQEVVSNIFQQASREGIKIAPHIEVPKLQQQAIALFVSDYKKEKIA